MKKTTQNIIPTLLLALALAAVPNVRADDNASKSKDATKPYPLKTCIVSDEKLEDMGKPATLTYKGQQIRFCCKDCIKDFKKDPDKYLKKLAGAQKTASEAKPK